MGKLEYINRGVSMFFLCCLPGIGQQSGKFLYVIFVQPHLQLIGTSFFNDCARLPPNKPEAAGSKSVITSFYQLAW